MPHSGRYIDEESFRRLMQRALIFPLILAIGLAGIFLWQVRGLLQINKWVDEGDQIISKAEHLGLSVTEMETGVRGYILFGTKDYQDFFQKSEVDIPAEIKDLKNLLADNPAQLAILAEVEENLDRWIISARETLAIREKAGSLSHFKPTGKGRPVMALIKTKLRTFIQSEIEVRNERFQYARRTTRYAMFFGIFLAFLLGLVLAIFSRRALMHLSLSYQGAFSGLEKKSQELLLSKQELERALGTRDEFISVASHELRTPITSLKLQLQMAKREISRENLPASIDRNVSISLSQVERLTNLVDKLLDISRIQTGRLEVELEKVDLSKLASELVEHFQGEFRKVGSSVSSSIEPGVEAACDRFRIEQVFVNLLTNAIKYGQGKPINVSLRKKADTVTFTVFDQGQGIRPEEQEKIFERFQRAGASKNVDGIGLGLYIARQVVHAHRGRIYVESDGSSGSAFHVEIPT